jgi:hypothetical protein
MVGHTRHASSCRTPGLRWLSRKLTCLHSHPCHRYQRRRPNTNSFPLDCERSRDRHRPSPSASPLCFRKFARRLDRLLLRLQLLKLLKDAPLVRIRETALQLAGVDESAALIAAEVEPSNLPAFCAHPTTWNGSRWRQVLLVHRCVRPDSYRPSMHGNGLPNHSEGIEHREKHLCSRNRVSTGKA